MSSSEKKETLLKWSNEIYSAFLMQYAVHFIFSNPQIIYHKKFDMKIITATTHQYEH